MKINDILENKQTAAVICLDQSSFFDIIDHNILISKLIHIGFDSNTISTIKSYFSNRKQYVELNTKSSDILLTGEHSIYQGSVLSCLFSNIFVLDLPLICHDNVHLNHIEYFKCTNIYMPMYIDDVYAVMHGKRKKFGAKYPIILRK